ncbi:urease accessory protein UreD [Roseobacter ponti]|uniref:Urease accessory protein UreD n=1 Tax=Roseobacter ponti TaxID=1891787 RepID=A0A858SNI6_9RHOB|nr:urease accessory protein UreD [Roseobacter ponti]QJF50374.1 urease accessory protein UreD [Roseobacter ponti]
MRIATPLDQPRAIGAVRVSAKYRDGGSHIGDLRQSGALRVLFPRLTDHVEAVLINTAGGITGGDRFSIDAGAGENARLSLTTQAAERAYRAQVGQTGTLKTRLTAAEGSVLHWLPQETILYEGAALQRSLRADLAPGARFVMVEPVLFGRRAMGEELRDASFTDRVDIRRAGVPLYRDGVSLSGDIAAQLDRPAIAGGARAMASLVWVAPEADGALDPLRDLIGDSGGVSLLRPGILVARLLAEDGYALRRALLPCLDRLTGNTLPQSWRL